MSFGDIAQASTGWPVLVGTGLLLGCITMMSVKRRAHLAWFLPVLLVAAITYVFVIDDATNVLILAPERLGIGVMALFPAVAFSFVGAWWLIRFGAADWVLVGAPLIICLLSTPLAGFLVRLAVCELTGDCP